MGGGGKDFTLTDFSTPSVSTAVTGQRTGAVLQRTRSILMLGQHAINNFGALDCGACACAGEIFMA